MRFPINLLVILFLGAIFCSCADDPVEAKFNKISNLVQVGDNELIYQEFDEHTTQYFDDVLAAALEKNASRAEVIGAMNGIPISTLMLYDLLNGPEESVADSLEVVYASETMLRWALRINAFGVFRNTVENPIRVREVTSVNGSEAKVLVTVPTGSGPIIGTTYLFNRENDDWKLNFVSTLRMMEKIHTQGQRSSGLTLMEYANTMNRKVDQTTEFKYRQTY